MSQAGPQPTGTAVPGPTGLEGPTVVRIVHGGLPCGLAGRDGAGVSGHSPFLSVGRNERQDVLVPAAGNVVQARIMAWAVQGSRLRWLRASHHPVPAGTGITAEARAFQEDRHGNA
ncbi:protein of unknown function [Rhodovastum atsumiense]|nr:protein of unknown function [Rhodovastum atsumiense]